MKKISEINIGYSFNHFTYGEGIVSDKTARTLSVTFKNGLRVKNTYRSADAPFSPFDF